MTFASLVRSADRGQVIPLFAISLIVLFGAAALAVDVGYWRYSQRLQQAAADSAAIAAANELAQSASDVVASGKADAASNGFTDGANGTTVTVGYPATGPYAGSHTAIEAIVSKQQPVFFANVWGGGSGQVVQTRAVARITTNEIYCIYALGGNITLHGGGGGGITAPTCGLITNFNLIVTGNANVAARVVGYVGNGPGGGSYPLGQPQQSLAVTDPCSTVPSCAYLTDLTLNHPDQLHTGCMPQPPPNPIPPGEYCSQLSLKGTVTFSPGLFVLDDGISANGNANITGTGVTLYNGGGVSLSGITFSGNINTNITAPTTGPLTGIVYYQPPANGSDITINGRAGTDIFKGVFYAPSAAFTLNGNVPSYTLLVAKSIDMNGGGLGATSSGLWTTGHAVLAE